MSATVQTPQRPQTETLYQKMLLIRSKYLMASHIFFKVEKHDPQRDEMLNLIEIISKKPIECSDGKNGLLNKDVDVIKYLFPIDENKCNEYVDILKDKFPNQQVFENKLRILGSLVDKSQVSLCPPDCPGEFLIGEPPEKKS